MIVEGPDLLEAALGSSARVVSIYLDERAFDSAGLRDLVARARDTGVEVVLLTPEALKKGADATTPQPLLAEVEMPTTPLTDQVVDGLALVLHDVRDPGNAGTLIRSAEAAGATSVILTGHAVDPFNPKTLRASAGSIFRVPVSVASLEATLAHFRRGDAVSFATVVTGGTSHREVDWSGASVVVLGNEGDGLAAEDVALCDAAITIDMAGSTESLNVGVAGALIMFEAFFQRHGAGESPPPSSL